MRVYFDYDISAWGLGVLVDFSYWSVDFHFGPINISIEKDG